MITEEFYTNQGVVRMKVSDEPTIVSDDYNPWRSRQGLRAKLQEELPVDEGSTDSTLESNPHTLRRKYQLLVGVLAIDALNEQGELDLSQEQ